MDRLTQNIKTHIKNVALFFAAPFIGLAYCMIFPFLGFGLLLYLWYKGTTGAISLLEEKVSETIIPSNEVGAEVSTLGCKG